MRSEIREGVQQAFISNYADIQVAAFEQWPEMTFYDAGSIMASLAANLHRYRRSPDERFILWAIAWVKRQARRYKFLAKSFNESHQLLYAAIERGLYACPGEDWAVEPADHEQNLYAHLLQCPRKIDGLMQPKTAKPSTMLYALTKSRMRGYRKFVSDRHYKVTSELAKFHAVVREVADPPDSSEKEEKYQQ